MFFAQDPLQIPVLPDSVPTPKEEWQMMKSLPLDEFINRMVNGIGSLAINLAIAILVFYVGRFIINKIYRVISGILLRRKVDASLSTFILSLVRMLLYFILIVTVIGILGIETSSFIAIFASAGVAIGMALSGTLQNFAGGVLILLLKPYRIGDYIEAQGYAGTVREIQIFHTIISTSDNKQIIIPNGGLSTGSVNNYSRADYRRVDWTVGISYGDNVETARKAILEILDSDDRIVKGTIEDDRDRREALRVEAAIADGTAEADNALPVEKKRSWWYRIFHRKVKNKIKTWQEEQEDKVRMLLPKTDGTAKVFVSSLGDSAVVLTVRAWTRNADYWAVYFSVNERIYNELPAAGINFPFPQMDVHLNGSLDTSKSH